VCHGQSRTVLLPSYNTVNEPNIVDVQRGAHRFEYILSYITRGVEVVHLEFTRVARSGSNEEDL
jgi:hypothetical protein